MNSACLNDQPGTKRSMSLRNRVSIGGLDVTVEGRVAPSVRFGKSETNPFGSGRFVASDRGGTPLKEGEGQADAGDTSLCEGIRRCMASAPREVT